MTISHLKQSGKRPVPLKISFFYFYFPGMLNFFCFEYYFDGCFAFDMNDLEFGYSDSFSNE